jgi:hypothetical protein
MKPTRLYIDQWGNKWWAKTVKELCKKVGYSKACRMYCDYGDGTAHIGYVVGPHWCSAYIPYKGKA